VNGKARPLRKDKKSLIKKRSCSNLGRRERWIISQKLGIERLSDRNWNIICSSPPLFANICRTRNLALYFFGLQHGGIMDWMSTNLATALVGALAGVIFFFDGWKRNPKEMVAFSKTPRITGLDRK